MCNPDIKIIPFNIFPSVCPYFKKDKTLKHTEKIDYDKDLSIYSKHCSPLIYDFVVTYLLDIDHENKKVIDFNTCSDYIVFNNLLKYVNFFNSTTTNIKPVITSF